MSKCPWSHIEFVADTTEGLKGLNDFQLVESNQTVVSGYPAQKLVYVYSDPVIGISKTMLVFVMQDERYVYTLGYFAKPLRLRRFSPNSK
jgi:hypothetical protein